MTRVEIAFRRLRANNEAALIPYLPVGYPTADATVSLVQTAVASGADLIELGVPFSDPLADGPTLQIAARKALANGTNVRTCLQTIDEVRRADLRIPLILMSYANPLLAYGLDQLATDLARVGGDGLIVPDLPVEASQEWDKSLGRLGIQIIRMLAPTTEQTRLAQITSQGSGFLYCVALTGVTGARTMAPVDLPTFLRRIRALTNLPLAVGFGISTPEQVKQVVTDADAAIVGSALVEFLGTNWGPDILARTASYLGLLKAATRRSPCKS